MKENDDVQNLKQSWNIENFEQCVEDIRPLLELYEVFELFFFKPRGVSNGSILEFVLEHDSNPSGSDQVN